MAASAEPDAAQVHFFEAKIRPILVARCYECHSAESGKQRGNLQLDTQQGVQQGGDTGPAIVAGEPDKSLLIEAVRWASEDLRMPPKKKLDPEEIADLETWVKMGAPDPRTGKRELSQIELLLEKSQAHWSMQPVSKPDPPAINGHPVDAFIRQKLHAAGLDLSPPADKRTLMRRAYLDLIGLPPTSAEVDAFVADQSPGAFETVIDRLLADVRYGERWGRHWLDVARYADDMGSNYSANPYLYAFTYRDYVIRSFNEDLPYDRFVIEQIAADLLPQSSDDNRALAALGFLTVGRRKDGRVDDDFYDDQIDVLGRGLLGLSLSCARCHDHKLEPVPTRDYYALYGVLRSCKEPSVYPELKPQPDHPERAAYLERNRQARANYVRTHAFEAERAITAQRARVGDYLQAAHEGEYRGAYENNGRVQSTILVPRQLKGNIHAAIVLGRDDWLHAHPAIFGPWLELAALPPGEFSARAPELCAGYAANAERKLHSLVASAFAGAAPVTLADVAVKYNRLFAMVDAVWGEHYREALNKACRLDDDELSTPLAELQKRAIDRINRSELDSPFPEAEPQTDLKRLLSAAGSPFAIDGDTFLKNQMYVSRDVPDGLRRTAAKAVSELSTHPGAPIRVMALFDDKPFDAKIFIRGNAKNPGADAPRQFLTALKAVWSEPFPDNSSGRLELARAIASPVNPLTSRVIVNRVWQWHFGEGLVRTPSDFGFQGERPTQPELLDYLATWFVENGWSFKKLHKHLLLSATYRQSSRTASAGPGRQIDAANRLLWSFPLRPLEFEPFRDAVLSVTGTLRDDRGGKPVKLADGVPTALRRTVYGFVDRRTLPNLYRHFDFPDPSFSAPQRSRTALTPRALFLINSPMIIDGAKALAGSLTKALPDDLSRLHELYRRVLQRLPTEAETGRALAFLAAYPPHDLVKPESHDWQYGFGAFDDASCTVKIFAALTAFDGAAWKTRATMPDGDSEVVMLNAQGGDPGRGARLATIRRWVAPQAGTVVMSAELCHTTEMGAGVVARLISNRQGLLGEWKAKNSAVATEVKSIEVVRDEALDFVVSSEAETDAGAYQWAPTIVMPGVSLPGMPSIPRRWDARTDFADPGKPLRPLTAWEELCQALLLSNEFAILE